MRFVKFKSQKGQSLVEMAITAPLLIFFLLGIFEVGVAIRGYLVLVNANREITRFAVRPGYLNFSTQADTYDSFENVRDWVNSSIADQLHLDFADVDGNTTMIISHIVVDTGLPCEDIYAKVDHPTYCSCDSIDSGDLFPTDDLIIHPGIEGMEYQSESFGPDSTVTGDRSTQIDYETLVQTQLIPQNNKFNCEIIKRGGTPSANNLIITELYYDQPQLFGFPLISNPLTDPVPLYSHTTMRLINAARSTGGVEGNITSNIDTIGEVCFAYPFIVKEDNLEPEGTIIDILDGPDTGPTEGNRGWLAWNPQENDVEALGYELQYPQMSISGYINPDDPNDTSLNIDDWVASLEGNNSGINNPSEPRVDNLIGKQIIIPVYDQLENKTMTNPDPPPGTINVDAYHVVKFIKVSIIEGGVDLTGNNPKIMARIVDLDPPDACQ